ncbi:MAG: hypothetical protein LC633_08095 [Desulfobulbaceae bacterium]|nr:hypothetical protein [Desulfobulbaceae bacterium]
MDLIIGNLRIPIENDGFAAYLDAASDRLEIKAELVPQGETHPKLMPCGYKEGVEIVKLLSKVLDPGDPDQFYYIVALVASRYVCRPGAD